MSGSDDAIASVSLSPLEEDADRLVEAAESNSDVATAIGEMEMTLSDGVRKVAELEGILRGIAESVSRFEELGGSQHQDGTNGGAFMYTRSYDDGADPVTDRIVGAINDFRKAVEERAESEKSRTSSVTRTISESARQLGDAVTTDYGARFDELMKEQRREWQARRDQDDWVRDQMREMGGPLGAIGEIAESAGSKISSLSALLETLLKKGFNVAALSPAIGDVIKSFLPGTYARLEEADAEKGFAERALREIYGSRSAQAESERTPEQQDEADRSNIQAAVTASLKREERDLERKRDEYEPVSDADANPEAPDRHAGDAGAGPEDASRGDEDASHDGGTVIDVARQMAQGQQQQEPSSDSSGGILEDVIGHVIGERVSNSSVWKRVSESRLGRRVANSGLGRAITGRSSGQAVAQAASAAPAAASGSGEVAATTAASSAIGGVASALSRLAGPIAGIATAYQAIQTAQDVAQSARDVSIGDTGSADLLQGAGVSSQLAGQRLAVTMTSGMSDEEAKAVQETLHDAGIGYSDTQSYDEAMDFARSMRLSYGMDVGRASRIYVSAVRSGAASMEDLEEAMDKLSETSKETGTSFSTLQDRFEEGMDRLERSGLSGESAVGMATAAAATGSSEYVGLVAGAREQVASNAYLGTVYNSTFDSMLSGAGISSSDLYNSDGSERTDEQGGKWSEYNALRNSSYVMTVMGNLAATGDYKLSNTRIGGKGVADWWDELSSERLDDSAKEEKVSELTQDLNEMQMEGHVSLYSYGYDDIVSIFSNLLGLPDDQKNAEGVARGFVEAAQAQASSNQKYSSESTAEQASAAGLENERNLGATNIGETEDVKFLGLFKMGERPTAESIDAMKGYVSSFYNGDLETWSGTPDAAPDAYYIDGGSGIPNIFDTDTYAPTGETMSDYAYRKQFGEDSPGGTTGITSGLSVLISDADNSSFDMSDDSNSSNEEQLIYASLASEGLIDSDAFGKLTRDERSSLIEQLYDLYESSGTDSWADWVASNRDEITGVTSGYVSDASADGTQSIDVKVYIGDEEVASRYTAYLNKKQDDGGLSSASSR